MINQRGLIVIAFATLALISIGMRVGGFPETHIAMVEIQP